VMSQQLKKGYMIFSPEQNSTFMYYTTRRYILNFWFSMKIGDGRG
jgi:hypothetical protein